MSDLKFKKSYHPEFRRITDSTEELQKILDKKIEHTKKIISEVAKLSYKVVDTAVDTTVDVIEDIRDGLTELVKDKYDSDTGYKEKRTSTKDSVKSDIELAKHNKQEQQQQQPVTIQTYETSYERQLRLEEVYLQARAKYAKPKTLLKQETTLSVEQEETHEDSLQLEYDISQTTTKTLSEAELSQLLLTLKYYASLKDIPEFVKVCYIPGDDAIDKSRASKYARFAAHSYRDYRNNILPKNCTIVEEYEDTTGLRTTLYEDGGDIVCAFAGTELLDIRDWDANLSQIIGLSVQYEEALKYARDVCSKYPDKKVIFVGHSKGGGEAAYCAYNLGKTAETYNPAGLSTLTKHVVGDVNEDSVINAYIFATDILNKIQDIFHPLVGADGNRHNITDVSAINHGIHGIEGILRYFDIKYEKNNEII